MDIVYSVSPLKAFSGSLFLLVFLFLLGGFGLLSAIFSRRQKTAMRVAKGGASIIILLLAGVGSAIATFNTYQGGQETVLVKVEEKNIVKRNCDRSTPCIDYVLDTTNGQKYYIFGVNEDTYNSIEVSSCYNFTYYPAKPLLEGYLQEQSEYENLYETTGNISLIERAVCP